MRVVIKTNFKVEGLLVSAQFFKQKTLVILPGVGSECGITGAKLPWA